MSIVRLIAVVALLAAAACVVAAPAMNEQALAVEGADMSAAQAAQLETKVMAKPADLASRIKLLGYYTNKTYDSTYSISRQRHALWVIQNRPECEIAGLHYAGFDPVLDGSVYEKAKSIWQRNIKNKSKNAAVLANAAQFFIPTDEALAERILVKAAAANPKSPAGFRRLGELYLGQMDEVLGESRPKYAAKALAQFEQALKLIPQGVGRFRLLPDAARAALESGNTKKASTYSNQLLLLSAKYGTDPNFGDAVHKANLVRGRAALRNGDITKAKSCLIAAGNTPGSPTIQSTGPGMALAGELLKKGEKDIVLEYLGLCEDLWEVGRADILAWKKAISEGQTPDFGANQLF